MKVRANFPNGGYGYCKGRRYHGDEFEVPDGSSDSWYVPVEGETATEAEQEPAKEATEESDGDPEEPAAKPPPKTKAKAKPKAKAAAKK